MPTIDEKRVYTDNTGTETVFVATSAGVVAVSVSDDLVGGFGIAHRGEARDVAAGGVTLAVATDEDVFRADLTAAGGEAADADGGEAEDADALDFEAVGFGPAAAVGFDGESLVAGDDDGRVARFDGEGDGSDAWTDLGRVGAVRAVDGPLVAAADGVHRIEENGLSHVGLDDARDVAGSEPLAATGTGLYRLGNGWMDVLEGEFDAVCARDGRAHAAGAGDLYARGDGGEWSLEPVPVAEDVAAVAHGSAATYAVTDAGTFLVRLPDAEWRHQILGLRGVAAAVAV
ncbi:hypothetical protein C474_11381 [Halogeometricum pallidum JCM 14848]|uniref:HVO-0234-like beta-propeller domain-containing protein n=1 Tax=Halogeometricum pallidum JCM 14848 TaxID=1227487 RepID=M0D4G5_HALPD|nr:hypothetical protein [Halogeometricum pallidum]ELZ30411.1 hypothetical protein C474_11381 [Halogeometricum pallidum JCM 14848]